MCGIFGFIAKPQANISSGKLSVLLDRLYQLSESRGKESVGCHLYLPAHKEAWTLKAPKTASAFLKSPEYQRLVTSSLMGAYSADRNQLSEPVSLLAHSRLVTNGTSALERNNQPVCVNGVTMIHNGIVVNVEQLWADNRHLERQAEVDTEVLAALLSDQLSSGKCPAQATAYVYSQIEGAASVAWSHEQGDWVILATNTGDLYYFVDKEAGYLAFASEKFILAQALSKIGKAEDELRRLEWLEPNNGLNVNMKTLGLNKFSLAAVEAGGSIAYEKHEGQVVHNHITIAGKAQSAGFSLGKADFNLLRYNEKSLRALRRCSRCVLPETFPFISYDSKGVCNYCHGYQPRYKGKDPADATQKFLENIYKYRRSNNEPDVLVPFSGGRDSSYGLHLIKKEFGLTPITFTYDWGMVTDLARRNVARICGQLGVQNILVSADIKAKRENIRKNVTAWLKRPDLGMVPLFMAGDKHFFSIVNRLKKQTGISLDLWSANPLENTDFKSGFCGVEPDFHKERLDYLSLGRKARMASYYGKNFLLNPGYINSSLFDTAGAFFAYYFEPRRDFYFMFNDLVWNEKEVNETLLNHYDWELASDTKSTWRIGDGTAPFYNYIYVTSRGFSEFDTFRSNQIREGMVSREEAMAEIFTENSPRPESINWYLSAIGLDFNSVVKKVNSLDSLGLHR